MFKPVDDKIDFPEMEKKWLKHWYENNIVTRYLQKNNSAQDTFSFLDGPITANNPMGIHHAWGRSYKDLWQKFNNLLGKRQRFQNGFDCQGLWVEVEVEKELGIKNKREIEELVKGDKKASIAKFVEMCKKRVLYFSGIQTEQTKRLGNFMDWDHSYFTMSEENNYMIWHFLKVCHENGWIYKGHESVPWCPRCQTAISQHEMLTEDYKEIVHESIYLKLPIETRQNEYLLVWTTTPWTIPANIAVAVDKSMDYALVETEEGAKLWLAKSRIEAVIGKDAKIIKTVQGEDLVGLRYKGPFDNLPAVKKVRDENLDMFHLVVETDPLILPISTEEGTGMVHTAVSAGVEDFKLGKKLGLPMVPVIADDASYLENLGFLTGKNAKKHPRLILDYLEGEKTWVYKIHNYKHRYPACWRCKTELVWKVADEWYIAMDKPGKTGSKDSDTLRQRMMKVAEKITWMPAFGLSRELDWLKNMHDWLISKKNRYWGLALPIYICKKCGEFEVIGSKEELKERAVSGWKEFEGHTPHKPYIDEVHIECRACKSVMERIDDVGNPWLDAGIVPYSTVTESNMGQPLYLKDKKKWKEWVPVDFITESFPGQFKNWFYAMIAESTVLENMEPFKRVLGFGTLLGEDGRAMHKSWGNSIEFNEGADKIGVDVIRWMFARTNPSENMLFGYKHADEVRRKFYLILWNVYKFFVQYSLLENFQADKSIPTPSYYLDKWILSRLSHTVESVRTNMLAYDARESAAQLEKFVDELSTWYLRRSRERIWVSAESQEDKKAFYQTMYYVLTNLSVVLSPFMPFLTEEIYTNLTRNESVHLEEWPEIPKKFQDNKIEEQMIIGRKIVELGQALRKENKIKVRQPLRSLWHEESQVRLTDVDAVHQIKKELNIDEVLGNHEGGKLFSKKKSVVSKEADGITVWLDTELTEDLLLRGKVRDIIRAIQEQRKNMNVGVSEKVNVVIPNELKDFAEEIKKKVLASTIKTGDSLVVTT